ncbi:MAG: DUF3817 domain-containing protein [Pseudomonas sp.]
MTSPLTHIQLMAEQALRRVIVASALETFTLLSLLLIAVPLKHLAGMPLAVSWFGPIHGLAFILYVWQLSTLITDPIWTRQELLRLLISGFIPFGGFFNIALFKKKMRLITAYAS